METFKDLNFKPHTTGEGLHGLAFFPNGYGVSVVRFKLPVSSFFSLRNGYGSYTNNEKEWEVAILIGNKDSWELTYETQITDDVIGYCTENKVSQIMKQVQKLPAINKKLKQKYQ